MLLDIIFAKLADKNPGFGLGPLKPHPANVLYVWSC
jgi:hypothetical protein